MEARGRREVKERRRRGRSGARRGTGVRNVGQRRRGVRVGTVEGAKGKKREVGNEVEKRVSGEK